MRRASHIPDSAALLAVFALLNGLAVPVHAQQGKSDSSSDSASSTSKSTSKSASASSSSPSSSSVPTSKSSASTTAPSSSSTGNTDSGGLTGLPTLTGVVPIPTYPPPAVPDTKNAPFMQHSSAPSGTVFIAVGAILGAFFLAVLIWRAIVSLLLHRSVERASKAQFVAQHATSKKGNSSAAFPAPPAPFYRYTDHESSRSPGQSPGRNARRSNRGPTPSSSPSQANLFFSPTAPNNNAASNRSSAYLPSGFYAAGSASPAHQHGQSINLSNLNPASGQYANGSRNTPNGSPPESPMFHARRDASSSSVNLGAPLQPEQRAPSAYLEDLLDEDPSAFPPPHMPGSGSRR